MHTIVYAAGLRVSELIGLRIEQLNLTPDPVINVCGKGRRERIIPLWKEKTVVLHTWISVRPKGQVPPEIFLNASSNPMTRSEFEYFLSKHVELAINKESSLAKKRIYPHVLRHTCVMDTLQATQDVRKVSLWLGHADLKNTEVYLRADPSEKLEALMAGDPLSIQQGKFKAPDKLLAMLKSNNYKYKNYA